MNSQVEMIDKYLKIEEKMLYIKKNGGRRQINLVISVSWRNYSAGIVNIEESTNIK